GFMIFSLSEFSSIAMLGLLVSGSLLIALFADLLLLPVILLYLPNKKVKPIILKNRYQKVSSIFRLLLSILLILLQNVNNWFRRLNGKRLNEELRD
ncbi:MAG: hypothetical protein KAK04_08820, partial [Cyclobacteriaceae bacterium]|nr:hypothetical protein [Cyclobacteriaceae bacterium]